jgi:hypothetical protein
MRWLLLVVALMGVGGCAGISAPPGPPSNVPPGCVDTFSGLATRNCL